MVCIGDCSFYWLTVKSHAALDVYAGARWGGHHNSVTNMEVGDHGLDTGRPNFRSPHCFEFDNNFFCCSPSNRVPEPQASSPLYIQCVPVAAAKAGDPGWSARSMAGRQWRRQHSRLSMTGRSRIPVASNLLPSRMALERGDLAATR